MEILLFSLGLLCILIGILGSFLPVLPGPPLSWVGLLLLYLTQAIPNDWWVLGITLFIALAITVLDYIIPAAGTKRFGGSRSGVVGSIIGLIIGFFLPIPGGIIIGAFVGALLGELTQNSKDKNRALKAAFGSFLGFITGTFLKLVVTVSFAILFIVKASQYATEIFRLS